MRNFLTNRALIGEVEYLGPSENGSRERKHRKENVIDPAREEFRWMLEELRVSLFAQELKTSVPVSPKRLDAQWAKTLP